MFWGVFEVISLRVAGRKSISGSKPVSRVMSRVAIYLGQQLPAASRDRPGSHNGSGRSVSWRTRTAPCLVLHPVGFTEPDRSPGLLVRSYRTVSPLPGRSTGRAVYFLLHFPCPRGRWALPTTVPCGARTFLHEFRRIRSDHSADSRY